MRQAELITKTKAHSANARILDVGGNHGMTKNLAVQQLVMRVRAYSRVIRISCNSRISCVMSHWHPFATTVRVYCIQYSSALVYSTVLHTAYCIDVTGYSTWDSTARTTRTITTCGLPRGI